VSQFDLVVLGDANPDLVLSGDVEPAFGQTEQLVDDSRLTIGGSGAIVACGAARLGLRVALCGVVGDDLFGGWLRDELRARGVEVRGLVSHPTLPTGLTVVLSRPDDRAILTHPGTIPELRASSVDREVLRGARHVHVSSYYLQHGLAGELPGLFDEVRALGATTSLDPNWDPDEAWNGGLERVLASTDVFLPNSAEALRISREATLDEGVRTLGHRTGLAVVKLGADGAAASDGASTTHVPALPVEPLDTTGAGDSFDAGFLAAWLEGAPLERALAIGNSCGALSTLALGGVDAQPTMDDVRRALEASGIGTTRRS